MIDSYDIPNEKIHSTPMDAAQWTSGFWKERFELCHNTIIPSMRKALDDPSNAAHFHNIFIVAGLEDGEFRGTNWSDGDCYKWIEAASHIIAVTGDKEVEQQLDELIAVIAKAQDDDGYISTQIQLTDRERWTNINHHELYNMGHLMTAAYIHFKAARKENFLDVARKVGDYLYETFMPRPTELAHFAFNPSNIMGSVDLYRATGDEKYLRLAETFIDMRGSVRGGQEVNQDFVPLREETDAVGHAVLATYLYCGATDVYAETGDESLMEAMKRIWHDVSDRKMYVTGAVGAHHHNIAVRRGKRTWPGPTKQVHEAFGMEYKLPNSTAYNETCANIGNGMWNWRMLKVTGEAKYADIMELVAYNSGLSGMSADGKYFRYTNPLRWQGKDHFLLSQDTLERWFTFTCYCCPPQVARSIARMHEWVYGVSDDGIWVHLYGGNHLDIDFMGGKLELVQETDYPWDGKVMLEVKNAPKEPFAIRLRIPGWAKDISLAVNGGAVSDELTPGSYVAIKRHWNSGDKILLELPMPVRLVTSHPRVEEARGQVTVMRGPVVYCLEGIDLPDGCEISDIHIPRDIDLAPTYEADLLGGIAVLRGMAKCLSPMNWEERLYQDLGDRLMKSVPIQMVPYFAWNNRGVSEMTVWLPVV